MFNNKPAARTQIDGRQNEFSAAAALDCAVDGNVDTARQEHLAETDINRLMKRYGVGSPLAGAAGPPQYTTTDYDIDLQQAMGAISIAQRTWNRLPASLKEHYPDWQSLLNGVYTGSLKIDLAGLAPEPHAKDPEPKPTT